MADIFIAYAEDDFGWGGLLIRMLETSGWVVSTVRPSDPGRLDPWVDWDNASTAACIVVVWSRASVEAPWAVQLAAMGLDRRNLVQVADDGVKPPQPFATFMFQDLRVADAGRLQDFLERVAKVVRGPQNVPDPLPAPSQFTTRDSVLELERSPLVGVPSEDVGVVWSVVRDTLHELRGGGVSNAPRLADSIHRTIDALGASPAEIDVIRSGMAGVHLKTLAADANNLLLEDAAALLRAASAQHAVLMAQFDQW